jgi:two-component system alkaline phosphatase synthesis response regulator PhoP
MSESHPFKILVVDDDADILDLLKYNLEKGGFKVKTLDKSQKAIAVATRFLPDLIILDIMMPQTNGIELCAQFRSIEQFAKTYIFFLTAKSESDFQQAALSSGGDDYIQKITGLRALMYKVNAVLKRSLTIRKRILEITIGEIVINRKLETVKYQGNKIRLSKPEFDLLFFLAQNPGKTISIENIIHNIWGSEIYMLDSSVEVYMDNLRKKISPLVIQRLQDKTYRFVAL